MIDNFMKVFSLIHKKEVSIFFIFKLFVKLIYLLLFTIETTGHHQTGQGRLHSFEQVVLANQNIAQGKRLFAESIPVQG